MNRPKPRFTLDIALGEPSTAAPGFFERRGDHPMRERARQWCFAHPREAVQLPGWTPKLLAAVLEAALLAAPLDTLDAVKDAIASVVEMPPAASSLPEAVYSECPEGRYARRCHRREYRAQLGGSFLECDACQQARGRAAGVPF
jgi:hypothetical protein